MLLLAFLLKCAGIATAAAQIAPDPTSAQISNPASLVNVFIGTINGGNVFPGATIPHGMAKPGMDTDNQNRQAGYTGYPGDSVTGFSQIHDDGTGGGSPLSNFKLFPFANCTSFSECPVFVWDRKVLRNILPNGAPDDAGLPGYFSTNLSTGIRVELTSTGKTALHRYTFPPNTTHPRIMMDINNDGYESFDYGTLNIDPTSGRITAAGNYQAAFGVDRYDLYSCADFSGVGYTLGPPTEYGVYSSNNPVLNTTDLPPTGYGENGGLLTFKPNPKASSTVVYARVGLSFISTAQACANAEAEIPKFDFSSVRAASVAAWNDILGRVQVSTSGVDAETTSLLYSSLYRTHLVPVNYTGENPKWTSSAPTWDAFYCNWDTFRNLYPLYSLHDPERFASIVAGMIDIQQHEGWLPECRDTFVQQYVQGSSNADPILAEFFVKYSSHAESLGVSPTALYAALVQDAEVEPSDIDFQGRQTSAWKQYGYIPTDVTDYNASYPPSYVSTVSRALEYGFGDFCIAQVASLMGNSADAGKYANRSRNYINVWNPNTTISSGLKSPANFSGFVQPKFMDGTFSYVDPRHCSPLDPYQNHCYLGADTGYYESSPTVYSQFVPHDTANLITLQGGPSMFVKRLNWIMSTGYYDPTDEPSMQIPFQYHYADRPGLSTTASRQVIAQHFNTSKNGLPGNDDSGAMGAYAVWFLIGMYPVPATRQILLSSPFFPKVSFRNPVLGTTTTIIAHGWNGNPTDGTGNVFIESVTIDGKAWGSNCYILFDAFEKGSTIELKLSTNNSLGCGGSLPPSLSTGGFKLPGYGA